MSEDTALERPRVLVIDDERGTRESVRHALNTAYSVTTAESVEEGLELLTRSECHVVILDLRLPGMSGIDGLRCIRGRDPHVAVVILTAYGSLNTAREAVRYGADDYQLKPFDVIRFQEVVDDLAKRARYRRHCDQVRETVEDCKASLAREISRRSRYAHLGRMTADLLHDVSSPLSCINVYVAMAQDEIEAWNEDGERGPSEAGRYLDEAQSLLQIITDMLTAAKRASVDGEHGGQQDVNLADVARDVVAMTRPLTAARELTMELVVAAEEEDSTVVHGDRLLLFRALYNLTDNALQAVSETDDGRVTLHVRSLGDEVLLMVRDNGPGVAANAMARLFDRYYTTREDGTGLGLCVAKQVAEEHGGTLELTNRAEGGAEARLQLPRRPSEGGAPSDNHVFPVA